MVEAAVEKDTQIIQKTLDTHPDEHPRHRFKTMEELVTTSFSSVDALNQSFPIGLTKLSYSRPNIDFEDVEIFYTILTSIPSSRPFKSLLKSTLKLLKRPRSKLNSPQDIFFLLIILENPIFNSQSLFSILRLQQSVKPCDTINKAATTNTKKWSSRALKSIANTPRLSHAKPHNTKETVQENPPVTISPSTFQFEISAEMGQIALQILERSISIISHTSKRVRHYLLNWLSRYPEGQFISKVELLNAYIAHRLTVLSKTPESRKWTEAICSPRPGSTRKLDVTPGSPRTEETLIDAEFPFDPDLYPSDLTSAGIASSSRRLEGVTSRTDESKSKRKRSFSKVKVNNYGNDWKVAAFARVQSILFSANVITGKVPISSFYNTIIDYIDIKADFNAWERLAVTNSKSILPSSTPDVSLSTGLVDVPLFSFCEYPFFLSMGTKKNILEYDAKRQMAHKAHEAFFTSLDTHTPQQIHLYVRVRRKNILHDSFQVFENNEDDLKKGIRVQFIGEPGIDVGGLRKEWFLLLTRELFDPTGGLFQEEEETGFSWFKLDSKQPLKYYKLTGVALGLALYNSTILDINLPPVIYKKLLGVPYSLEDFKIINPSYGQSLQQLLDYKGADIEDVFCLTFSITKVVDGKVIEEDLVSHGSAISVTKSNRQDYVKRLVAYHLDTSIKRMFEPLKQGFYKVVGSNALTLFRPEEIELLIRGSDEAIDVDALRAVTRYNHWSPKYSNPDKDAQVVKWFWRYFKALDPKMQRKLLMFVTGSDRIPATGISTMQFTITRSVGSMDRYPVSHTCFNELCLYEYDSKQKLVNMLTRAITDSEGFGLK